MVRQLLSRRSRGVRLTRVIGRAAVVLSVCLTVAFLQSCRFPRDIEGTLDKVEGGVLDIGVTENAPWVIRTDNGPTGLEPDIARGLAEKLDADIRWHWGNETEHLRCAQAVPA